MSEGDHIPNPVDGGDRERLALAVFGLVMDAVARRRDGEVASVSEYVQRHPYLVEEIERQFALIDLLESS